MCGRFSLITPARIVGERFRADLPEQPFLPKYNAAPGQPLPVITNLAPEKIQLYHWGLIPFWAKDPTIASRLINARSESLSEKPSFKGSFKNKRCLVLADGFYEWKKTKIGRFPYRVTLKNEETFALAGLWNSWRNTEGKEIYTFTIITTPSNAAIAKIHNRMPAILQPEDEKFWLDTKTDISQIQEALKPYPANLMKTYPISKLIDLPVNDTPEVIKPIRDLFYDL